MGLDYGGGSNGDVDFDIVVDDGSAFLFTLSASRLLIALKTSAFGTFDGYYDVHYTVVSRINHGSRSPDHRAQVPHLLSEARLDTENAYCTHRSPERASHAHSRMAAATATASSGRKIAVAVLGAGLVGYGGYYGSQLSAVRAVERQKEDLETKVREVFAARTF